MVQNKWPRVLWRQENHSLHSSQSVRGCPKKYGEIAIASHPGNFEGVLTVQTKSCDKPWWTRTKTKTSKQFAQQIRVLIGTIQPLSPEVYPSISPEKKDRSTPNSQKNKSDLHQVTLSSTRIFHKLVSWTTRFYQHFPMARSSRKSPPSSRRGRWWPATGNAWSIEMSYWWGFIGS